MFYALYSICLVSDHCSEYDWSTMNLPEPLNTTTSFDLRRKLLFSVSQNLISSRSCGLVPPQAVPLDPWNIKAPDFTPKLYRSVGLPRIKSKNIHLVKSNDSVEQTSFVLEKIKDVTPLTFSPHKEQPFITCYKPPDSLETKLLFVRAGTNPVGPYKDPKPHNFRPVSLNNDYCLYYLHCTASTLDDSLYKTFKHTLFDCSVLKECQTWWLLWKRTQIAYS